MSRKKEIAVEVGSPSVSVVRNLKDELKTGALHGMCSQIGIKASDL